MNSSQTINDIKTADALICQNAKDAAADEKNVECNNSRDVEEAKPKETFTADNNEITDHKTLSLFDTIIMITTWTTAGAIIAVPYSFGQFGYIGGSILLLFIILLTLYYLNFLLDVADSCKDGTISCLGDVGYELAGENGRKLFETFQYVNLIFWLPVGLQTITLSFQYIVNGNCTGMWNIICCVVLYCLLQCMQCWHHMVWIGYITATVTVLKAFVFLPYAYMEYQDEIQDSPDYLGPVQAFGNPNPTWYKYCVAMTGFFYAFAPVFILIEIRSGMKDPSQCKKALNISASIQISLYLVAGIMGVVCWGYNVQDPITIEIPRGWLGILLSVLVLLATVLDYCIAAKISNDWVRSKFFPDWSKSDIGSKLLYTLPTTILAIVCLLVIPEFDTLIAVLVSISIIGMNTWATTLAWEVGGRRYKANRVLMWTLCSAGLILNVSGLAGALYEVIIADYSSNYFCG
jgi:hypothetical protein